MHLMEKVIAVVVTYNRRQLLENCLQALRSQVRKPDAILVVDNGSTDNTRQWLSAQKDVILITQKNSGSGGGFHTGIKWAHANQYSWVWCMDDDGYPQANALQELLAHAPMQTSLLNCAVIDIHDKKSFVWKTGKYTSIEQVSEPLIKSAAHPFNGTLIHRSIIDKVGLPKSSLFLWGDESEYLKRITHKYKYPVYTVTSSLHYHPPATFHYNKDWDYNQQWKMYYYIRNRWQIHQTKFSNKAYAIINYTCFLLALAAVVLVFQKTDKAKKLSFIVWPLGHAISSNYSVTPQIVMQKLNTKNRVSILYPLQSSYKHVRQFFSAGSARMGNSSAA